MRIGVAYYPEHWPMEKWPEDFNLMKEANISFVRMGEFAWCKLEPEEDQFEFRWMDHAIDLAFDMGLDVVLGTPTAGIPAWLAHRHPEVFKVDEHGHARTFGGRSDYCVNQPVFLERSQKIVRALAAHFGPNHSVIGWQIDNEPGWNGIQCYCEQCLGDFREWLRERYGSIENLNRAWGTIFGGQQYRDWNQVPLLRPSPLHNPALLLDAQRFFFESHVNYLKLQSGILREHSTSKFITTNIPPLEYDGPRFAESLDFISFDCYPTLFAPEDPSAISFLLDLIRGYKQGNFWVMEQQVGIPGDVVSLQAPKPGQVRLWTYQSVAHGAEAVCYFRWRTCLFGPEQFWQGILSHSRHRDYRFDEVKRTGVELRRLSRHLDGSKVESQVAILYSAETAWAFGFQPHLLDFEYRRYVKSFHAASNALGIPCDVIFPRADFSSYSLLIAPALWLVDDATIERLVRYVYDGGALLASVRTAVKEASSNVRDTLPPAQLGEVFGIAVPEYRPLKKPSGLKVIFDQNAMKPGVPEAEICAEKIELKGASIVATYQALADDPYNGCPSITHHAYGGGHAVYVGTIGGIDFTLTLLQCVVSSLGLQPIAKVPRGVEVIRRTKKNHEFVLVLNHSSEEKDVDVPFAGKELLTGCELSKSLKIEPRGVRIIEI